MADSKRKQIMDQVLSALSSITSINYVSEKIVYWEELDHSLFPASFPLDEDEEKEPVLIMGSVGEGNMASHLRLRVTTMLWDAANDTRTLRCQLIQEIERKLCYEASGLLAIVHGITPTKVNTDHGAIENYSVFDQEFDVEYRYDYRDGG